MSTTLPAAPAPGGDAVPATPAAAPVTTLAGLRAELDRIDDALHDLLMERAAVSARVGGLGAKGRVQLRPGREAAILRRLLDRNRAPLPPATVARVWREIVSGSAAMQAPLVIAVCEASDGGTTPGASSGGFTSVAREQFGALVRLRVHRTPAGALRDVGTAAATAAVLPVPREDEPPSAAWWTALLHPPAPTGEEARDARIRVVGRLPFWAARPDGAPRGEALLVSAAAPDPSGEDRSLLGLELPPELSRARLNTALAAAGLQAGHVILRRVPGPAPTQALPTLALAEVDGFIRDDDPRLGTVAGVLRPPVVLGAYAVPFSPQQPGGGR